MPNFLLQNLETFVNALPVFVDYCYSDMFNPRGLMLLSALGLPLFRDSAAEFSGSRTLVVPGLVVFLCWVEHQCPLFCL